MNGNQTSYKQYSEAPTKTLRGDAQCNDTKNLQTHTAQGL